MKKRISQKLNNALDKMLFHNGNEFQFFFYFLNYVDFYEWEEMPPPHSMCVTVKDMRLALLYHPKFVESHNEIELIATMIHEVKHLLHNHLERGKYYEKKLANIAMDMIINHLIETYHKSVYLPKITEDRIQEMVKGLKEEEIDQKMLARIRKKIDETGCVTLDKNYKGELVFEPLFKWLKEQSDKEKKGQKNELSQDTKDMLAGSGSGETLDHHMPSSEVMDEIKKQLGNDAMEKVKVQLRGFGSNNIEEAMKMLLKAPANNNLRQLKRVISAFKGRQKTETYHRLNRRIVGLKGNKKVSQAINVLLDVSASMYGRFDVVLSELYRDGYEINLIQVDTKIQKVERIKRKTELKSIMIKGLGGTCLTPGIRFILDSKNKLNRLPTVILSDGETDTLDFQHTMNQFLIITVGKHCPTQNKGSNIREILIEG